MSLRFSISRYRASDSAALERFYPEFRQEVVPQLRQGPLFEGAALVARHRGRAIGFVFAKWYREACYFDRGVSRYGELEDVIVDPRYWNRGVGTALVRRAVSEARRNCCEAVYLITDAFNSAARHVYEKCGFRPHNPVIRYKRPL